MVDGIASSGNGVGFWELHVVPAAGVRVCCVYADWGGRQREDPGS